MSQLTLTWLGLRPEANKRTVSGFRRVSDMTSISELSDGHPHVADEESGSVVPERTHQWLGDTGRAGDVHAGAAGQADFVAGAAGSGIGETPRRRAGESKSV
jgi:hypothetical protein